MGLCIPPEHHGGKVLLHVLSVEVCLVSTMCVGEAQQCLVPQHKFCVCLIRQNSAAQHTKYHWPELKLSASEHLYLLKYRVDGKGPHIILYVDALIYSHNMTGITTMSIYI